MTPMGINSVSEPILLADGTSVIIPSRNFEGYISGSNVFLSHIIKLFVADTLVQNLAKANIMNFITKNYPRSDLCIGCKEKCIEETTNTKVLGI